MKVGGEYTFDGPQELVWDVLQDPDVLASVLPGCEKLDLVGENEYQGALKLKVGPVQGQFQGKVRLTDIQPPESYTMEVDGKGAPGFVKATGDLHLTGQGATTLLTYTGDARIGGRLASVGGRLMESSAKAIIKQSLDGLNGAVKARSGQGGEGGAEPARAPTQTEFATSVAREVARDVVPAWLRTALTVAAVVLLVYLLYAVFT